MLPPRLPPCKLQPSVGHDEHDDDDGDDDDGGLDDGQGNWDGGMMMVVLVEGVKYLRM